VEAIEGHGGELRTNSLVSAIEVERNRVVGVRLASGESVRAPVVVSNADYRRTILDLVGPAHLPPATVARAARASMALPLATLYLAIAEPAMRPLETNIWWHEHEDVDAVFAELALGGGAPPRFAFISSGSAKTGSSVPHHTVEVMTLCPAAFAPGRTGDAAALSHEYRTDGDYRDAKERLDASLFALAERALGPLAGQVLYRELSTPLTHIRFARSTGGTPYGIAATPQQFGLLRPAHATPLPGLFLVGASTVSGFGIVGVSVGGVRCAEVITGQSLLREVYAGKLIGDPARLPDRPPGWDPLSACRGSRAARHPSRAARR